MSSDERSFKLDPWKPDESVSADKLNQTVKAVRALTAGIQPPRQVPPNSASKAIVEIQQFQIEEIAGDYLVCNPFDGIQAGTSQIVIARPWMLRRSQEERNGLTFEYTDDQSRTATNEEDETEDQVIVPAYVVGDVIYAVKNVTGGTGVTIGDSEEDVEWLDMNLDARAWAKAAS